MKDEYRPVSSLAGHVTFTIKKSQRPITLSYYSFQKRLSVQESNHLIERIKIFKRMKINPSEKILTKSYKYPCRLKLENKNA